MIKLSPHEKFYLDDKFFLVKKGKVIAKDILANGKVISNENCLREGELIGNFFNFLNCDSISIPSIDIEVEALENSILEEFKFSEIDILNNIVFEKILSQLIKKSTIKFLSHLYDKKGYILAVLKLYANSKGIIPKKEIRYENFNIGRSQFYAIYSNLKEEKFLNEDKNIIYLNLDKINIFLDLFENDE